LKYRQTSDGLFCCPEKGCKFMHRLERCIGRHHIVHEGRSYIAKDARRRAAGRTKKGPRTRVFEPIYVNVHEAADLTSLSAWTWRHFCYEGRVEYCKLGNRLLIPMGEVRRILAESTHPRVGAATDEAQASA